MRFDWPNLAFRFLENSQKGGVMKRLCSTVAASLALALAYATPAGASDLAEGAELYISQCKICHGDLAQDEVSSVTPFTSPQRVQLAMESVTATTRDFISQLIPAFDARSYSGSTGERLAFAPPLYTLRDDRVAEEKTAVQSDKKTAFY